MIWSRFWKVKISEHYDGNSPDVFYVTHAQYICVGSKSNFVEAYATDADWVAILGGAGNDTIICGASRHLDINAGVGNDLISLANMNWATVNGGDGNDTVDFSRNSEGVSADLTGGPAYKIGDPYVWSILKNVENLTGSGGSDRLTGSSAANLLSGDLGNDSLYGGGGNDTLKGGAGDDIINGGTGNDVIRLDGGGNDTFIFDSHFGQDSITRVNPADANGQDVVQFNGINVADILFQRQGDDLRITVAASTDTLTLLNWYAHPGAGTDSPNFDVDQFQAGEVVLSADTVEQMVTIVGAAPVSMAELSVHI